MDSFIHQTVDKTLPSVASPPHQKLDQTGHCHLSHGGGTLTDLARNKFELVAENVLLRQQLLVLRRHTKRPVCNKTDRMLLVFLARMVRTWKQAIFIVQPETLLRWHRQGFRLYWKYKSRAALPKPKISPETVALIKEMARDNLCWLHVISAHK
jgi:putative transposase